jgi:WD40 repeat protein
MALEPHGASVIALTFSPDGRWLASGSWDGEARLYLIDRQADGSDSSPRPLALKHPNRVTSVLITADSRWFWTAGEDGVVRGWDLQRCEMLQKAAVQAGANTREDLSL